MLIMKKNVLFICFLFATVLLNNPLKAQNQVYWRESFANFVTAADPGASTSTVLETGDAGVWKTYGVWRTTGTSCVYSDLTPNPHIRSTGNSGLVDTAYLVSPLVDFGINEFHMLRSRSNRKFTIYTTTDTDINTTNWTLVSVWPKFAASVNCVDSVAIINSPTAKRVQIRFERAGNSDIDSVFITSVNAIVPVKFGSINISQNNGLVKLSWNVLSEINTLHYNIERSKDAKNFEVIGQLTALKLNNYNYFDHSTLDDYNYYRIKAIDKDGKITYSNVLKLNGKKTDEGISVYPNPIINGIVNLQLNNLQKANYFFTVFNAVGKQILVKSLNIETGTSSQNIELPNGIAKGVYQLQISNGVVKINKSIFVQ